MKLNKELIEQFVAHLRNRIVSVSFIKKDGTNRDMNCTLSDAIIPPDHTPKGTGKVTVDEEDPELIRVFDVDAQGWRTIIFDSVTKVSVTL